MHLSKKTVLLALGLLLFTFVLDAVAVRTGFPYGYFWYGQNVQPIVSGVPLVFILGFPVLYLASSAVVNRLAVPRGVPWMMAVAIVMTAVALVVEPVAVAKGLWSFRNGGLYFGVPSSDVIGWLFTGSLAGFLFPNELRSEKLVGVLMLIIAVASVEAVIRGLGVPAVIGVLLFSSVAFFDLKKHGWKA
ncbi:MAG: carotenoid biosynthesis protein [Patescibacteria group bacterium]|jgi:putative membrane protein